MGMLTWVFSWVLVFLLLLGVSYVIYRRLFRTGVARRVRDTKVEINDVSLSIDPLENLCDRKTKFKAVVEANGWSYDGVSRNVEIRLLYDEIFRDELDKEPKGMSTIKTVFPSPLPDTHPYPWTVSRTITSLYCTKNCIVKGPRGCSDESSPSVYAEVKVLHGNPIPNKKSNIVTITCKSKLPEDDTELVVDT